MKKIHTRIEFWIFIFFLVRLIGITNPPLETSHNWRQVTGLMVARNFVEIDSNILYPRIDDANGNTGIIGMEFPTLNYLYFLISYIFGYTHWYGRLINLIISSLGLFFFYKLVRLANFTEKLAFTATIVLASSIWFSFSRKMMPDTYCISIMFMALYFGIRYVYEHKFYQIILYIFFSSCAVLSKIPAGIYLIVPVLYLFNTAIHIRARFIFAIASMPALVLTYIWYFIWNPALSRTYGNWYNVGKSVSEGFFQIREHIQQTLDNFYFDAFHSFILSAVCIVGIVSIIRRKQKKMILIFFVFFTIFLIYVLKSGYYFYHHNYYIIPFVPIMALLVGYMFTLIQKKWIFISVLSLGIGESIANQHHDFFIKETETYKMSLEQILDSVSSRDDLIVVNGNGNPQLMYFAHRKGWNCIDTQLFDSVYIRSIVSKGCSFIVCNKHALERECSLPYKKVFENNDFVVFFPQVVY